MRVLEASNVSVRKGPGRPILDDASMRLSEGEMVGLIGPNGAGKTTLLRVLVGLQKADTGKIALRGTPVAEWKSREIAREIAYLAQNAVCSWPMQVERVVALGRLPHLDRWSQLADDDLQAIERVLKATNVAHLRARKATTLSGGEQARVMLARALAVGAPTLFADEPVSGLDPGHQIQVMELLSRHARGKRTTVAVLHDLTLASRYCSRLILMCEGRIVADGSPEAVLSAETLAAVYGIEARIGCDGGILSVVPCGLAPGFRPGEHHL